MGNTHQIRWTRVRGAVGFLWRLWSGYSNISVFNTDEPEHTSTNIFGETGDVNSENHARAFVGGYYIGGGDADKELEMLRMTRTPTRHFRFLQVQELAKCVTWRDCNRSRARGNRSSFCIRRILIVALGEFPLDVWCHVFRCSVFLPGCKGIIV